MRIKFIAAALSAALAGSCQGAAQNVEGPDEAQWLDYTLPLPQEISIKRKIYVAPGDIGIKVPEQAGAIENNAAAQLRRFLKGKTGIEPAGDQFSIIMGVLDRHGQVCGIAAPDADRLRQLPHKEQAYLIRPAGANRLVLAALAPPGIYYAAQTLRQLLDRPSGQAAVAMPLATVTDWPDMDGRGLWNVGYASPGFIPWLASLKLNFAGFGTGIILKQDLPALCPALPMDLMRGALDHAFLLMPHAPHFDYWFRYGAAELYPELSGKGDGARNPCHHWGGAIAQARAPCMATPLLQRLLGEWMAGAAGQGVREFSIWLSEHTAQCECQACLRDGRRQMQRETRAAVDALRAVREKYPDLRGRVFFTMTTTYGSTLDDIRECLALLPPEIKAEQVYASNAAYKKYAADGHWLAQYSGPPLGPGYFAARYMADEIKDSLAEYYAAKYSALYCRGRALAPAEVWGSWEREFCNYQYSALAEWSWNVHGRNPRQFARAWAVRNDLPHPEQFAAWIEMIRPVESFARHWQDQPASAWLQASATPGGGAAVRGCNTRLPDVGIIRQNLAICERALPLAGQTAVPAVLLETQYLAALLQTMEQIQALRAAAMAGPAGSAAMTAVTQALDLAMKKAAKLGDDLMQSPALPADSGPQQSRARHAAWIQAIADQIRQVRINQNDGKL